MNADLQEALTKHDLRDGYLVERYENGRDNQPFAFIAFYHTRALAEAAIAADLLEWPWLTRDDYIIIPAPFIVDESEV